MPTTWESTALTPIRFAQLETRCLVIPNGKIIPSAWPLHRQYSCFFFLGASFFIAGLRQRRNRHNYLLPPLCPFLLLFPLISSFRSIGPAFQCCPFQVLLSLLLGAHAGPRTPCGQAIMALPSAGFARYLLLLAQENLAFRLPVSPQYDRRRRTGWEGISMWGGWLGYMLFL